MNRYLSIVIALILLGGRSFATDLVIDKILISKHPIPAPYFVYLHAQAGRSEATFHVAKKSYGHGGMHASPIEIPLQMKLKDVQLNTWATVNLHLDTHENTVASYQALKKHTARIHILEGTHSTQFIPELHDIPFIYELFYHTQR
jgi:hypothetical protein